MRTLEELVHVGLQSFADSDTCAAADIVACPASASTAGT